VGFLGTGAGAASDVLILGEIVITVLVYLGVRKIRRNQVSGHRTIMLTSLALNLLLLASFLVVDIIKTSNTIERGLRAPLWVFIPLLVIHLSIAVTALTIAIRSWLIARTGVIRDGQGAVVNVTPEVRAKHRRISRYYPRLWYSTLGTGLLLYLTIYVFY
jgi:putative membrane protein